MGTECPQSPRPSLGAEDIAGSLLLWNFTLAKGDGLNNPVSHGDGCYGNREAGKENARLRGRLLSDAGCQGGSLMR